MSSSFLREIYKWNASQINDENLFIDSITDLPLAFDDVKMWSTAFEFHMLEEMRSNILRDINAMDFSISSEINLKSRGKFDGEIHEIVGTICSLNRNGNCNSSVGLFVKSNISFHNESFPFDSENFLVKINPLDFPSDYTVGSDIRVKFSFGSGDLQDEILEDVGNGWSLFIFNVMTIHYERVWSAMKNIFSISSHIAEEILNYGISDDAISLLPLNLSSNKEVDISNLSYASNNILSGRNHSQQVAIQKVHSAGLVGNPHVQIIHGPPGLIISLLPVMLHFVFPSTIFLLPISIVNNYLLPI